MGDAGDEAEDDEGGPSPQEKRAAEGGGRRRSTGEHAQAEAGGRSGLRPSPPVAAPSRVSPEGDGGR